MKNLFISLFFLTYLLPHQSIAQNSPKNNIYVTAGGHGEGAALGLSYEYNLVEKTYIQLLGKVSGGIYRFERDFREEDSYTPFFFIAPVLLVGARKAKFELGAGVGYLDADNFLQAGITPYINAGARVIHNDVVYRGGLSLQEGLYLSIGYNF
jgi:hypothetical protein